MDVTSIRTHLRVADNETTPAVRIEENIAGQRHLFIRTPITADAGGELVISGPIPAVMTWLTKLVGEINAAIQHDAELAMEEAKAQLEVVR